MTSGGKKKSRAFHTKIAGVTKTNPDGTDRQKILKNCKVGEKLNLVRDSSNKYDRNAIMVCRLSGDQLGWLSREIAEELAPLMDEGNQVDAEISDLTGGGIVLKRSRGCNIKVTYWWDYG